MSHKVSIDDRKQITDEFEKVEDVNDFLDKIQNCLKRYSNDSYRDYIMNNVPGIEGVHGVPLPVVHFITKVAIKFCNASPGVCEVLIRKLWNTNKREERIIACEVLAHYFEKDTDKAMTLMLEFIPDIDNREICDTMACVGLKPYTLDFPDVVFRMISTWIKSPNPWIRRFGIMSLLPLARNEEQVPLDPYFIVLKKVIRDKNKMVQKAVAGLLRELTSNDEIRIAGFLEVFARISEPSTKRIIKDGSKKLNTDLRNNLLKIL